MVGWCGFVVRVGSVNLDLLLGLTMDNVAVIFIPCLLPLLCCIQTHCKRAKSVCLG